MSTGPSGLAQSSLIPFLRAQGDPEILGFPRF